MSETSPKATFDFTAGGLDATLEFLKRTRSELRTLRRVRVYADHVQVFDVNGDYFEVHGIGYLAADVIPILQAVHTNYNPDLIHVPSSEPFKEFLTGKRYCWAQDRVM